jgi:signal recognition particle subunit SRP54
MGGMSALLDKLPAQMQANAAAAAGGEPQGDQAADGHHRFHDAARAPAPGDHRRLAQTAHCSGAGVQLPEVNRLLKQFDQMQKTMKKLAKGGMLKNMMRGMGGRMPPGFGP